MCKVHRNLYSHTRIIFAGLFSVFNLFFFTDVFAEMYISKQSMKSCFDRYGSGNTLFAKCCLAATTNKPIKKQVKCKPGQYVPKDSMVCSVCDAKPFKNRYFCPGGIFEVPQSIIQGGDCV